MAIRSTQIQLQNNTDLDLTLIFSDLCHGSWSNGMSPPSTIASHTTASWQSEDSTTLGVSVTGTEGWAKYEITNPSALCVPELVYIYWDNPFIWGNSTQAINWSVTTTDVSPPCDAGNGQWDTAGGFPHGGTNPSGCTHCLIGVQSSGNGIEGISWFDVVFNWPALLGLTELGQADINLSFTLALALQESVCERVGGPFPRELLAIATSQHQPSLRKLLHM